MEVGEGSRLIRVGTLVLAFLALIAVYDLREYKNFHTEEAMDFAQLGRNISEGKGFETQYVRPFSLYLVHRHKGEDARLREGPHPDLAHPPVYPLVLGGLMKLLPFDFDIQTAQNWRRHQPEVLIAIFNQALFLLAIIMVFRIAVRLFDTRVAWLSAAVFAGAEVFWRFSSSGLDTMLCLILFLSVMHLLVVLEEGVSRESPRPVFWFVGRAIGLGLLIGLGGLTRYSFAWLLVPVLVYFLVFFGQRRWMVSAITLAVALVAMVPWLVRNYQHSGTLFGTAGFAVYHGVERFQDDRLIRSLDPDFGEVKMEDFFRKFVVEGGELVREDLPRLGGSWMTGLFLPALLLGFRKPAIRRLRWFLVSTLVVWSAVQAMGSSYLSERSPVINTENLLVLVAPMLFIFGAALFFLLLDQVDIEFPPVRTVAAGMFVLIVSLPLLTKLLPPREIPVAYPPYWPPVVQEISRWMELQELVMSDMPWALAWYGNRQSVLLTLGPADPFFAVHDYEKPVQGLYLTAVTLDLPFMSELIQGPEREWGRFIMESWVKGEVPEGFPLRYAPADFFPRKQVDQLFFSDWPRWNESFRKSTE